MLSSSKAASASGIRESRSLYPVVPRTYDRLGLAAGPKSEKLTEPLGNEVATKCVLGASRSSDFDAPLSSVYQRIRNAVLDGTLAPGARLPSSRSLAGQLSVARGTVALAYALVADEGYVAGMRRTGTIVNAGLSGKSVSPGNGRRSYGSLAEPGHEFVRPKPARPFQMALPALDEFPRKVWARLVARRARGLSAIAMVSQDPAGYALLRQAISGYLAI